MATEIKFLKITTIILLKNCQRAIKLIIIKSVPIKQSKALDFHIFFLIKSLTLKVCVLLPFMQHQILIIVLVIKKFFILLNNMTTVNFCRCKS